MDDHVVHRNGGEVVAQRQPAGAAGERHEDAELGTGEQQVGVARVLDDDANRAVLRQIAADVRPVGAVVGTLDHVGAEVVVLVRFEGSVEGPLVVVRPAHPAHQGHLRNHRGDIRLLPAVAVVTGDLHEAVVGAHRQQPGP